MNKTTSMPYCLQIPGGGIDIADIEDRIIKIDLNIKRELKEEINIDLDDISYKLEYIEYPSNTRNAYGFIALGKINKSKEELEKHFEEYKKYLVNNNLELEFNRLVFVKKGNAIEELDSISNPKRPYLRDLINKVEGKY